MTTFTNLPKSSASKWTNIVRAGQGWLYDQIGINYDGPVDSEGRTVFYDSLGVLAVWANKAKSSASVFTNQTKS